MNHSPAPWSLTSEDEDDLVVVDAKGQFICCPSGETLGQAIDNGQLIVSAPVMLASLQRLVLAAQRREITMGDQCNLIAVKAELEAATIQGEKAIAKILP